MESKLARWLDLFAKQWVGKTLGIVFSAFRNDANMEELVDQSDLISDAQKRAGVLWKLYKFD